jgi:zinc protease
MQVEAVDGGASPLKSRVEGIPLMLSRGLLLVQPYLRTALAASLVILMLSFSTYYSEAQATPVATEFELENGMKVVVVEDHRAPVVTHMVWYRTGAADEPPGVSGIAHFLEHLMFKSTDKIPNGEFSKIVSRLGGQDNAFTGQDVTAYYQRVAKDRLPIVMEMEADRMVNLRLDEKEVLTERNVILEERRSRTDNNPSALLDEQMSAMLYLSHPYGKPVIGWEHEMSRLTREDALTFYKRFYAPNNAILIVSGDVTPDEVKPLAEATFGKIPSNPGVKMQPRPQEPPHLAARRVELKDPRAGKPSIHRNYLAPAYLSAQPEEAEALDLLLKVLASGATSRIYKRLVIEDKVASSSGGWYSGSARDSGKISLYAVPVDGVGLDKVEAALDRVVAEVRAGGITAPELERAKKAYLAEYIYESDNQVTLARRYGWSLTVGRTVKDIEEWPDRIAKVSLDDVAKVAAKYLDIRRSVTGTLLPMSPDAPATVADTPRMAPMPANAPAAKAGGRS